LYSSIFVQVNNNLQKNRILDILPANPNVNSAITVGFKVPVELVEKKDKLVLRHRNNASSAVTNRKDSVFFDIKHFGTYELLIDNEAPLLKVILPVRNDPATQKAASLSFTISDKLSGVGGFNLYLNNKWVLADYDAKSNLITYYFDEIVPQGNLHFKLEAFDKVGNRSTVFYAMQN
jgi:hypothetical protein